jgi:hypothetical protein
VVMTTMIVAVEEVAPVAAEGIEEGIYGNK